MQQQIADTELQYRLRNLVRAAAENEAAFHAAAATVRGDEPRVVLLERAALYGSVAAALRALADERPPQRQPGASGPGDAVHGDDLEIVAQCERREDLAAVAFRDALDHEPPPAVRAALEREFAALVSRLGGLRTLRERMARRQEAAPTRA